MKYLIRYDLPPITLIMVTTLKRSVSILVSKICIKDLPFMIVNHLINIAQSQR